MTFPDRLRGAVPSGTSIRRLHPAPRPASIFWSHGLIVVHLHPGGWRAISSRSACRACWGYLDHPAEIGGGIGADPGIATRSAGDDRGSAGAAMVWPWRQRLYPSAIRAAAGNIRCCGRSPWAGAGPAGRWCMVAGPAPVRDADRKKWPGPKGAGFVTGVLSGACGYALPGDEEDHRAGMTAPVFVLDIS